MGMPCTQYMYTRLDRLAFWAQRTLAASPRPTANYDATPAATQAFWAKRGFCADACLPPEAWALLLDGFGNSRVMSRQLSAV